MLYGDMSVEERLEALKYLGIIDDFSVNERIYEPNRYDIIEEHQEYRLTQKEVVAFIFGAELCFGHLIQNGYTNPTT